MSYFLLVRGIPVGILLLLRVGGFLSCKGMVWLLSDSGIDSCHI
jgi:hypothetical protein